MYLEISEVLLLGRLELDEWDDGMYVLFAG